MTTVLYSKRIPNQKGLGKTSGIGGGGYPSPKGRWFLEEGRQISLDHLRPAGWWDVGPWPLKDSSRSRTEAQAIEQGT